MDIAKCETLKSFTILNEALLFSIKQTSMWCFVEKLKDTLLEIGFIEELRTTSGNKEVSQTCFHNSLYSQNYDLIRLTPCHWLRYISQFRDITKDVSQILWHQKM